MHDSWNEHEHQHNRLDAEEAWLQQEQIELRSVGIDIGSSTSHLSFSRLVLLRMGVQFSSRFQVVQREVVHESPILLTPYSDATTIDTEKLGIFIHQAYQGAKLSPETIDTGAVVITGEAAKKANAEAILALFAREAGRFVCATTGPQMEAIMAAHGSGSVALSHEEGTVLNVDIGGGTTKLAICQKGEVVDTAVINVGGRLVAYHDDRITRLEEAGVQLGEAVGRQLVMGEHIDKATQLAVVDKMVDCLFELIDRRALSPLTTDLMHTRPLSNRSTVGALMFSGGVSEYVYGRASSEFGDLGKMLGEAIKCRLASHALGEVLIAPVQGIRATVIGAAQYTVQLSGGTIFYSRSDLLPLRNLPVLSVSLPRPLSTVGVAEAVRRAVETQDPELIAGPLALAIRWPFGPSYQEIRSLGEGLSQALGSRQAPVVLAFDRDIARQVGHLLVEEVGADWDLVTVDEVELSPFDYIDVGGPLQPSGVVPVVIKSLVFRPSG